MNAEDLRIAVEDSQDLYLELFKVVCEKLGTDMDHYVPSSLTEVQINTLVVAVASLWGTLLPQTSLDDNLLIIASKVRGKLGDE